MVDVLIKNLNAKIADRVANVNPSGPGVGGPNSTFQQILGSKRQNALLERMQNFVGEAVPQYHNQAEAISAKDIQVTQPLDGGTVEVAPLSGDNMVNKVFGYLNQQATQMDSIVEVLSSTKTPLSRRQLLAYQASIGTLTINVDLFSKLAQTFSQNLNTLLQTNLG